MALPVSGSHNKATTKKGSAQRGAVSSAYHELRRWALVARYEILSRYADTKIGVFWLPLSNAIIISLLIGLFARSERAGLLDFAIYVSFGYVFWIFISDSINGGSTTLRGQLAVAGSHNMSITQLFLKTTFERAFGMVLSFILFAPLLVYGDLGEVPLKLIYLSIYVLFGIGTSFFLAYLLSVLVLFVPDLSYVFASATRFLFFASPVFWVDNGTGFRHVLSTYNPVAYYLYVGRMILGAEPYDAGKLITCLAMTTILALAYFFISSKYENKFWNIQ